jgi:hypothetical protein
MKKERPKYKDNRRKPGDPDRAATVMQIPVADAKVVGQFADGRVSASPKGVSPVAKWWRSLSRTWRVLAAAGAAVLGSATFYVTAAQAYDYYWAGYTRADEVTNKFNDKSADEQKTLFAALGKMKPMMDQIDELNADGNEAEANTLTVAYRLQAAEIIKADPALDYDAETFFVDLNNAAICAKDGCDRDALIANMGVAFCRADRKLGGWLEDFRTKKTKANFAQPYVDLLSTLPCNSILYENPIS